MLKTNVCNRCGAALLPEQAALCSECIKPAPKVQPPFNLGEDADRAIMLAFYRSIMNRIHEKGNIFYDKGRMAAYSLIAKLASELRNSNRSAN